MPDRLQQIATLLQEMTYSQLTEFATAVAHIAERNVEEVGGVGGITAQRMAADLNEWASEYDPDPSHPNP